MGQGESFVLPSEHVRRAHVLSLLTVIEGTVGEMSKRQIITTEALDTLVLAFKFFKQEL